MREKSLPLFKKKKKPKQSMSKKGLKSRAPTYPLTFSSF
jgi:hypothetical protein